MVCNGMGKLSMAFKTKKIMVTLYKGDIYYPEHSIQFDYIMFSHDDSEYMEINTNCHIARFYVDDKMTYQITSALIFAKEFGFPIFNEKGEKLEY